ncbi:tRNA pseudouridine(38-40) synthase TruA [Xylocopilactobacillus apicola]|uniref:tRNA pseudouridine synthase A n=1 Tax=Xylocopilactobacillus apicola TaxID=2932184 RepID=A0AAU9DAT4_9LACO|nr:tRNA pseudouridine(38-40) synthase TruA [Xylocopilactobacillus apicola]BDR59510.1 tRNA pseudouridine synthase A [Xylocopilactobacillus apicola]
MRYKAILKYDGTRFSGFQLQASNLRTVQGVIENALMKMSKGERIVVFGASRTDAGVHALGQVIHFDYKKFLPPEKMRLALNSLMPLDVEFTDVQAVDDDFHARFAAHEKTYLYRVARGRFVDPFKRFYTTHYPYPVDLAKIEEALKDVVGTHDFTSFAASGGQAVNKVRTISKATVESSESENELKFYFTGDGFLYNQVRIMVGVLLEIGNGRRPVHDFLRLYEVKDRKEARWTAPASGLYLQEVHYL